MTTRRFALLLAIALPLGTALLAIGAATDVPALEVGGAAIVIVLLIGRVAWQYRGQGRLLLAFAGAILAVAALGFVAQRLFG